MSRALLRCYARAMCTARLGGSILIACAAILASSSTTTAQPAAATRAESKAAEAIVVRWLVAQNEGNFAAYQALYAQSFTGTKRVGKLAKTFDRDGWIKDRKAMFKNKMKVTATPLEVSRDGAALVVTVLQHFEQGQFADVGEKRLVLDLRAAAGPILSEEMLASRVFPSRDACARALFPQSRGGRTGPGKASALLDDIESHDLGTELFLCRLTHKSRGQLGVTLELAAVKRGKPWTVIEQVTHEVQTEAGPSDDDTQELEAYDVSLQPIRDDEQGFLLELQKKSSGPGHEDSATVTELFRVTPTGFDSLLRYETKWSDGEALRGTRCILSKGDQDHAGFHDLDLDCVTTVGDYHNEDPDERGEKQTEQRTVYRWDGKKYAKRK